MTSNQLKRFEIEETRRANQAREAENIRSNMARELELNRTNLANESLKNRENLAKYGSLDYASGEGALDSGPWKTLKSASDLLGSLFNPINWFPVIGGKKR